MAKRASEKLRSKREHTAAAEPVEKAVDGAKKESETERKRERERKGES